MRVLKLFYYFSSWLILCYTINKGDDGLMYNSERIDDIKRILNNDEVLFEAFNSLYEFVSE